MQIEHTPDLIGSLETSELEDDSALKNHANLSLKKIGTSPSKRIEALMDLHLTKESTDFRKAASGSFHIKKHLAQNIKRPESQSPDSDKSEPYSTPQSTPAVERKMRNEEAMAKL